RAEAGRRGGAAGGRHAGAEGRGERGQLEVGAAAARARAGTEGDGFGVAEGVVKETGSSVKPRAEAVPDVRGLLRPTEETDCCDDSATTIEAHEHPCLLAGPGPYRVRRLTVRQCEAESLSE